MFGRRFILGAATVAMFAGTAPVDADVLYREVFPRNSATNPDVPRGQRVLDQGWDIIRSAGNVNDILAAEPPEAPTNVPQNSGAIFGGDGQGLTPVLEGVRNPSFIDEVTTEGFLFGSAGWHPFLFFTEEIAGENWDADDVERIRMRTRNNGPNSAAGPGAQVIHAALKVDGAWYISENSFIDPDSSNFTWHQIDTRGGNWAALNFSQLDFNAGTLDVAELAGDFDLAKPEGTVEGIGFYNATLTGSTRTDVFEVIPEPATAALLGLGGLMMFRRRRA